MSISLHYLNQSDALFLDVTRDIKNLKKKQEIKFIRNLTPNVYFQEHLEYVLTGSISVMQ